MNRRKSDRGPKKAGAWGSALVMALLVGAYASMALVALAIEPDLFLIGPVFLIWLLVPLAVIVGVFAALRQRLEEIDGGEEDDAAQY